MIIAVDFDGILCKNDFPNIGYPNYEVIALVQELIDKGNEVILWTTRNGDELAKAVVWCEHHGLHFTSINKPAPSNTAKYAEKYDTPSRKIYADVYIDDHNLEFVRNVEREDDGDALRCVTNYMRRILGYERKL